MTDITLKEIQEICRSKFCDDCPILEFRICASIDKNIFESMDLSILEQRIKEWKNKNEYKTS